MPRASTALRRPWENPAVTLPSLHRLITALSVGLGVLGLGQRGSAEAAEASASVGTNPDPERLVKGFASLDRPIGMAEANVGVLTLPDAEVCAQRSAGCNNGDLSFALEGWEIYRANLRLAFGAGFMLGLIPIAHPRQAPEAIERDHTRSYLTVEGVFRYYPYVGETMEVWIGPVGGLVVLSDQFQVANIQDDRALLGTRGVTIRTEGGSIGAGTGFAYQLAEHWALIGSFRFTQWFLPSKPATDPLGSEASLTGKNTAFSLSFGVAYRLPL
jgi:hypothetical protein